MGLGVCRSCDIITHNDEDKLFTDGILGEDTPAKLLTTVIYMIGLHCALWGGVEHNKLHRPGCNSQFRFECDNCGIKRLVYVEDPLQKTNQGGLLSKNSNKTVYVYPSSDIRRCPVYYFKKYVGLLPESRRCKKLYLRARKQFSAKVWFCDQPYGFNKIKKTVKEICKSGALEGKYMNHSLCASCASRMYEIIKEVTGHRSDCVQTYKHTPDVLREVASKTVSGPQIVNENKEVEGQDDSEDDELLPMSKMIENVAKTKQEIRCKCMNKSRLKLKRKPQKISIDLNIKMMYKNKIKKMKLKNK